MAEGFSKTEPVHERGARGERAPLPSRRFGFSHSSPGYHDSPGPSKGSQEKGKRSVRARKRKILSKEEA
jgi:hypothetical protein